jgi:cytochrome c-type biogenesis protein CcmH
MRRFALLALSFLFCAIAHAAIDPYDFNNETQRERYRQFIEDMRCPKCQNQNLAGSDAPIAKDLRHELHRLLIEGKSDQEIVDYMVSRYGEFVLYKPPFDKKTAILWLAPVGFLLIGASVLIVVIRRRSVLNSNAVYALSDTEQQKLAALLAEPQQSSGEKRS